MNHPRSRVDYIIWNSLEISTGSSYSIRVMKDAKKFNKEPDITTSRVSTTSRCCSSPALWCSQPHRPVRKVKHNLCWRCTAQQLVFFVDTALKISLCAAHILSVYLYTLFEIIVFSVFRVQIFKRCYKKSQPSVCTDVNWAYSDIGALCIGLSGPVECKVDHFIIFGVSYHQKDVLNRIIFDIIHHQS